MEDLVRAEYRVTWQEKTPLENLQEAWHAANRAQGIRSYFTPDGLYAIPRDAVSSPPWVWGLSLFSYGRGSESQGVQQARLFADENRIRLDRVGIGEWFVNESRGLEHGFELLVPPEVTDGTQRRSQPAHLDLKVRGTLTPALAEDHRSVRFVGPSGVAVLYYSELRVWDAEGLSVPAWFDVLGETGDWKVRLVVDDREATYPIVVDPLATTAAWTGEIDQAGAALGIEVGTAGDVNGDGFDDVIVGAFHFDNGAVNEGAAFVYLGSAEGPSTTYDWMVEGDEPVAFAGNSVGTAGDVNDDGYDDVIVGVPLVPYGRVWVFHGSPSGLSRVPDWEVQSDQLNNASFGFDVGLAGDVNGDGYDDVVVGAHLYDSQGFSQNGRVYVYHGSENGLSVAADWINQGDQNSTGYGLSTATAGDVDDDGYDDLVVGAYWYDNGEKDEGRAYLYHGSDTGLSLVPDWTFEIDVVEACLGGSVSSAGDVNQDGYDDVIVGAAFKLCSGSGSSPLGRAYVFHGSASGLPTDPDWVVEHDQLGGIFGHPVATAGDVNDDGYDDALVGSVRYDNGEIDEGAVFLYLGSESGLTTEHAWMVEGNQADSKFGFGAETAGDVDGDTVDDVIIGAYWYDNVEIDEGAAFVYLGSTAVVSAGRILSQTPLRLNKTLGNGVRLTWGPSCLEGDSDYEIYEGELGDFSSHTPLVCSTGGATGVVILPSDGSIYYLIVPRNTSWEGSYGLTSDDLERPRGAPSCLPQAIGECE